MTSGPRFEALVKVIRGPGGAPSIRVARQSADAVMASGLVRWTGEDEPDGNYNEQRIAANNKLVSDLIAGFEADPWMVDWLNHHEPDLMYRVRAALADPS